MLQYAKSFVMLGAALLSAVGAALTDGKITQPEGVNILLAVLAAAVVFTAPDIPGAALTKPILAALTAAAAALASIIGAGGLAAVTPAEWLQVGLAVLAAIGALTVPNAKASGARRAASG